LESAFISSSYSFENYNHLRANGVNSLALFGSVARDEAKPDSDVDILVDFELPLTFDRYNGCEI